MYHERPSEGDKRRRKLAFPYIINFYYQQLSTTDHSYKKSQPVG